ncbi:MAG: hypothetical protein HYV63_17070 [Candidatus Schekmanbacteria bacterium]|nr:hypothetical protein [Candidatus Schekmanbacteria bacterium]
MEASVKCLEAAKIPDDESIDPKQAAAMIQVVEKLERSHGLDSMPQPQGGTAGKDFAIPGQKDVASTAAMAEERIDVADPAPIRLGIGLSVNAQVEELDELVCKVDLFRRNNVVVSEA